MSDVAQIPYGALTSYLSMTRKGSLDLMQGSSAELRELAAEALGELVDVTSQEALRPFTVQITGALFLYCSAQAAQLHTLANKRAQVSVFL